MLTAVMPATYFANGKKLPQKIVVWQNLTLREPQRMDIPWKKSINKDIEIWLSESGIKCWVSPWDGGRPKATVECTGPGEYRFQTSVECDRHNSLETSSQFFIGLTETPGAHRNFKIYCE